MVFLSFAMEDRNRAVRNRANFEGNLENREIWLRKRLELKNVLGRSNRNRLRASSLPPGMN